MIRFIVTIFIACISQNLFAGEQYFIDETATRLPQLADTPQAGWFVDVDSDEDLDLIVENYNSYTVPSYILMNDGTGTFHTDSMRVLIDGNHWFSNGDLGDADGDGDVDIVFCLTQGLDEDNSRIFINDGLGHYSDETDTRFPGHAGSSPATCFADSDGDTDLEVFFAVKGWEILWENIGSGYYYWYDNDRFPNNSDDSFSMAEGDVDGDYDLDVFIGNNSGAENRLYMNENGYFFDETDQRLPSNLNFTQAVAVSDIDADRDIDVITVHAWTGNYMIYVNNGHGYFTDETAQRIPYTGAICTGVNTVDFDNDGDMDIFITTDASQGNGTTCRLFINDGGGYYSDETATRFPIEEDLASGGWSGDIDNDGDCDIIVLNVNWFDPMEPIGLQNRLLINVSNPDSIAPVIARTYNHPDTGDTTKPYIISTTAWDNISVTFGELQVDLAFKTNGEEEFTEENMYDCGGYIYRRTIPSQSPGTTIEYYISARDKMGNMTLDPPNAPDSVFSFKVTGVGIEEENPSLSLPVSYSLSQNYPNPFNPSTVIQYSIPEGGQKHVSLCIYDLHGKILRRLVDRVQSSGIHHVHWDGKDDHGIAVASGIYFYRISAGDYRSTKKMTIIR